MFLFRPLSLDDLEAIQEIQHRCFPDLVPWSEENLKNHLATFPEGQIGIELDGKLVASSSSLILDSTKWKDKHTFEQICPRGYLSNHDPEGNLLYGIDIVVDPDARGMRLARRIYEARMELVEELELRKIVIAGRIPGYAEHADAMNARQYVKKVVAKELADPVLTAQLANGFVIRSVLQLVLHDQPMRRNQTPHPRSSRKTSRDRPQSSHRGLQRGASVIPSAEGNGLVPTG